MQKRTKSEDMHVYPVGVLNECSGKHYGNVADKPVKKSP